MAALLLIAFAVVAVYAIYKFAYAPYQVLKHSGVKNPPTIPFFGNYLQFSRKGILEFEKELFANHESPVGYYIGQLPCFLITDLEMIKEITVKQFNLFMNHPPRFQMSAGHISDGLLLAQGEEWRHRRKTLGPTFSAAKMKLMVPLIERSARTLTELVGDNVDTGRSFNVYKLLHHFTMETILATAFGRVIDVQRGESDSLSEASANIFKFTTNSRMLWMIFSNFPWLDPLVARFIRPSKSYSLIYSTLLSLVKARREENQPKKYNDLLQLIMDATGEEVKEPGAPKDCSKLSDDAVVNVAIDMLLAGNDTTATTLSFACYLLALHPDVQEKLQAEITSYYEENPDASYYKATSDIEYLNMVVLETLRLYPVVPRTVHVCNSATVVHGIHFPAGAFVNLPINVLHHDPKYWPEPEKFDPMRFSAAEKAKRPQLCYMPFGHGPRSCIGMRLALLETKMGLIELLKRFTFVIGPDTQVPVQTQLGFTLFPVDGIYLRVTNKV